MKEIEESQGEMQIQQLRYLLATAGCSSLRAAAQKLFISQSTLSIAIKDLEKETGTVIFERNSKGIYLTDEGAELLGYARQIVDQVDLMTSRYARDRGKEVRFAVSSQHYSLVVEAFGRLVSAFDGERCNFFLNETSTDAIISDVRELRSEIGVLYLSRYNDRVMKRALEASDLEFRLLYTAHPHVFVRAGNPLAEKSSVAVEDLSDMVRYEHEQGASSSAYFSEEPFSGIPCKRRVRFSDNGSLVRLLSSSDGYTVATGVYPNEQGLVSVPVATAEYMQVGYIARKGAKPTPLGKAFLFELAEGISACTDMIEPSRIAVALANKKREETA